MSPETQFWINILKDVIAIGLPTWIVAWVALSWREQMRQKARFEIALEIRSSTEKVKDRMNSFRGIRRVYAENIHYLKEQFSLGKNPIGGWRNWYAELRKITDCTEWEQLRLERDRLYESISKGAIILHLNFDHITRKFQRVMLDVDEMRKYQIFLEAVKEIKPRNLSDLEKTFPSKLLSSSKRDAFQVKFNTSMKVIEDAIKKYM